MLSDDVKSKDNYNNNNINLSNLSFAPTVTQTTSDYKSSPQEITPTSTVSNSVHTNTNNNNNHVFSTNATLITPSAEVNTISPSKKPSAITSSPLHLQSIEEMEEDKDMMITTTISNNNTNNNSYRNMMKDELLSPFITESFTFSEQQKQKQQQQQMTKDDFTTLSSPTLPVPSTSIDKNIPLQEIELPVDTDNIHYQSLVS
jgi:hypothetical protein